MLIADEDGNDESQIEADHEFLLQLEMRSFCFWKRAAGMDEQKQLEEFCRREIANLPIKSQTEIVKQNN
jgi:hypothetical protein